MVLKYFASRFCGCIWKKKITGYASFPSSCKEKKKKQYKDCCIINVKPMIKNGSAPVLIIVSGISLSAKAMSQRSNKRTVKPVTVTKAKQFLSAWDATENKQLISYWNSYFIHSRDMELPNYRLTCMIPKSSNKAIRKSRPITVALSDNVLSKAILPQSR